MNHQSIEEDCEIVGISFKDIDSLTVKDVISAYRKKALKVHPDKVQEADKEKANEEFKILNNSYERLLKYFVQKVKEDRENELSEGVEVSEEFSSSLKRISKISTSLVKIMAVSL